MQVLKSRIFVLLLSALLATLITIEKAYSDQELVQTAITGTEGDDDIANGVPASAGAVIHTNISETVNTSAIGIDSMGGDDNIENNGTITSDSASTADVDQALERSEMQATSIGITAGPGDDAVTNASDVVVTSDAHVSTVDADLPFVGDGMIDISTAATAVTVGLDGSEDRDGIDNAGGIDLLSNASSVSTGVSLTVDGVISGGGEGQALSAAGSSAHVHATGIDGGSGSDSINNHSTVFSDLYATATALDVGILVEVAEGAAVSGIDLSDVSAFASAGITGITGDAEADVISNNGILQLNAGSNATSVGVTLLVSGTADGGAAGSVLSDTSATAAVSAKGISGGQGDDDIDNLKSILVDADAVATAVDVGTEVGITIEEGGSVSGATASNALVAAEVAVSAIQGDNGSDQIDNSGDLDLEGRAEAIGVSVSLTVNGTMENDATGASASDAGVTAGAIMTGIDAGEGIDTIGNEGEFSRLLATSSATGVSASLDIAGHVAIKGDATGAVAGTALSDSAVLSGSVVTGISGGDGADMIENIGDMSLLWADTTATGVAASLNVSAGVGFKGDIEADISGAAISDARVISNALASGIDGGAGDDTITNGVVGEDGNPIGGELVQLLATSTATGVSASLDIAGHVAIKGDATGAVAGTALSDSAVLSGSVVTGISGGDGADMIENIGDMSLLWADTTATGVAASLNISAGVGFKGDIEADISGAAISDARVISNALASGIDGGAGDDTITNGVVGEDGNPIGGELVQLLATSSATGVAASLDIAGSVAFKGDATGTIAGSALSDTSVHSGAVVTGIGGGDGTDDIRNTGDSTSIFADADATGVAAVANITTGVTFKGDADLDISGAAISSATTTANASVTGIAGDAGVDAIYNEGNLAGLVADSTATGVAAGLDFTSSLNIKGNADVDVSGESVSDTSVISGATATGIDGGREGDTIDNTGGIGLQARSGATGVAASLDVTAALTFKGVSSAEVSGEAASKSRVAADAAAIGIDGGDGDDFINNYAMIDAITFSEALGVAASLDVTGNVAIKGIATGDVSGIAMSDSSAMAHATSIGINGGAGEDDILNEGLLSLMQGAEENDAQATAVAASLSIAGTVGVDAAAAGTALAKAGAHAEAAALGIAGGKGDDIITTSDQASIVADVDAEATGVAAALGIQIAANGESSGAALSDAGAMALATAVGIGGGEGADDIDNAGDMSLNAGADATGVAVSLEIAASGRGTSSGEAMSSSTATAMTAVTAISGGEDADIINNTGTITLMDDGAGNETDASATAVGVSVSLSGTISGIAEGGAVSDAGALASASATGLDGGNGEDEITNEGTISSRVDADSDATSASISLSFSSEGTAGGVAIADSTTTAVAETFGIDGGADTDIVRNTGTGLIDLASRSRAEGLSLAIALSGSMKGVAEGAALTDASTMAFSDAVGLAAGAGNDSAENDGMVSVFSEARAESTSISIDFDVAPVSFGSALADARSEASALATGISGGDGADRIDNGAEGSDQNEAQEVPGGITAEAGAVSEGTSVSFALKGLAMGETTNTAQAEATGIDSGAGADDIYNREMITARSDTTAEGLSVSIALAGEAAGNADTFAGGTATGIVTGSGADSVENTAAILVTSAALAESDTVSVALAGTTDAHASTTAQAVATGIATEDDNDRVVNQSTITVNAGDPRLVAGTDPDCALFPCGATARAGSVSLTLAGDSEGNASSTAGAIASGIDGGKGDDEIENAGIMTVTSLGLGKSGGFTLQLAGDADSDSSTSIHANTIGITGGSGNDVITNTSTIENIGEARGSSRSYTIQLVGEAGADARVSTEVLTSGITGDVGNDRVENHDTILATASAVGETKGVAVNLVGAPGARADVATTASAEGIDGGSNDDEIVNTGTVRATAESLADVETEAFTVAGVTSTEGLITSTTQAAGIVGGYGADLITNRGSVIADGLTTARSVSSSVSIFGEAGTSAGIKGTTSAVGISGGDGVSGFDGVPVGIGDEIRNHAMIEAIANSIASTNGDSFALAGGASAGAFITADSLAAGIEGSLDADTIRNTGSIRAAATSETTTDENSSVGLGGDASAGAEITAESTARGIATGGGGDDVLNLGALEVDASAYGAAIANSNAGVFFGDADGDASGATMATGIGMDLGSGDHEFVNLDKGTMTVTSVAHMQAVGRADGADFAAGDGIASGTAVAHSDGYGVYAEDGDTVIDNAGAISVTATTIAETCKRDTVGCTKGDGDGAGGDGYGAADASAGDAVPMAAVIWLGDGDHTITNSGSLYANINATAEAWAESDGDTVGASATVEGDADMNAAVFGIRGGAGTSTVSNTGDITVDGIVNAMMHVNTNPSRWSDGYGTTTASSRSAVEGYGIVGDGVLTTLLNDGVLTVEAQTNPEASPDNREIFVKADGDAQDATTDSVADTVAYAGGLVGGGIENILLNSGDVIVDAHANTAPRVIASSDTGGEADVISDSTASAAADGILGNGILNWLTNDGLVEVHAEADIDSKVSALTGSTAADADATDDVEVIVQAHGVSFSDGDSEVLNTSAGHIAVDAAATASLDTEADTNTTDSDADAEATASVSSSAEGLGTGDGRDVITSNGLITVHAGADSAVETGANGGDSAHGISESDATSVSVSHGIHTGDGLKEITNTDMLAVTAVAAASTDSYADDDGGIGDFEIAKSNSTARAGATGIETGAGNDILENTGSVMVSGDAGATAVADTDDEDSESGIATAVAEAYGIRSGGGNDVILNSGEVDVNAVADAHATAKSQIVTIEAMSVGIDAGDGGDAIFNSGSIISSVTEGAGPPVAGIAIAAGAGNDMVFLYGDSLVEGVADLGEGDDQLIFRDQVVITGRVVAGGGSDTVRLEDRGHFFVPELLETEHYQVEQGTLQAGADVVIPDAGGFRSEIYNPGPGEIGYGRLLVDGVTSLAGTATVIARPRIFSDGEVFPLLTAERFSEEFPEFDAVILPPDSALVSFGFNYRLGVADGDVFEVAAAVNPFGTVAQNSLQRAVAGYLERIAPDASGDLAEVIGTFQLLPPEADFDTAFTSLSPDLHDNYTVASHYGVSLYHEVLSRRMRGRRVDALFGGGDVGLKGHSGSAYGPLLLAYNDAGGDAGSFHADGKNTVPAWWHDLWGTAFGEWGDQDSEDGYTGFDYDVLGMALGFDRQLNKRLLLGAGVAYSYTDVDQKKGRGDGDIKSLTGSLYGSYTTGKAYVDGALSYGRNSYDSTRRVSIDLVERNADSNHDGNVIGASLDVGYLALREEAVLEPYGRLQYIHLDEESFNETGAGAVSQKVDSRDTESLTSEVGMRITRAFEKKHGRMTADASIGWLHDFDIDDRTITTAYTGAPDSVFSIKGQDVDRNGVVLGAGLGFENRAGISTSLNYKGEFRGNYSAHGIIGQISYRF